MMESHENPESDKIYPSAPLPPSAGAPLVRSVHTFHPVDLTESAGHCSAP